MTDVSLATQQRRVIYVGNVGKLDTSTLENLFIPFGPIQQVSKSANNKFAFVQYEEPNDAADAIDNMHNYVVDGNVLSVSLKRDKVDDQR